MADRKLPEYVTEQADGGLQVQLERGIVVAGAQVETLTMREPTVGDEVAASKSKGTAAEQEVTMIANLCEIEPDAVMGLRSRDYRRLQAALGFFLD